MKTCRKCKITKPGAEFYSHPAMADGTLNICKLCVCAYAKRHRLANPHVQEYDRKRSRTPKRGEHLRAISVRWRRRHPEAYRAQTAVGNAIRDGKLARPQHCQVCGASGNLHKHIRDYARPLDTVDLCAKCHVRLHALFPELTAHRPQS